MRKCIRCHTEMVGNLDVKVDMQAYVIKITRDGKCIKTNTRGLPLTHLDSTI